MTPNLDEPAFRAATPDDASTLAAVLVEGFETYRVFAPPEFVVPAVEEIAAMLEPRLGKPTVCILVAEEPSGSVAGYVALLPAADSRRPDPDPRLMHFWQLFVRAPWWGTGLARRLHAAACEEAASRGFAAMRLFTPAEQARARRFYEREGWRRVDGPYVDEELGLSVVEYRRDLAGFATAVPETAP
jgi:GNAT superfamily N-acetyltransferase